MPHISRQLDQMIRKYPKLRSLIVLYEEILQVHTLVEKDPKKGTKINWNDQQIISDLQQRSRTLKLPISVLLDPLIFDEGVLLRMCEELAVLHREKNRVRGLKRVLEAVMSRRVGIIELVAAALKNDTRYFKDCGRRLRLKWNLLFFLASMLVQPCLKEIAHKVDRSFLEEWWRPTCPICGRKPYVAKIKTRKRYLLCPLCGAEYLADQFLCVNCGNTDPYTLKFLAPEGFPWLRVDFCEKCRHYTKVIDTDKLEFSIPDGLEDIFTVDLDMMAKDAGLVRD